MLDLESHQDEDHYYMAKALLQASQAERQDEVPVGALLVKNESLKSHLDDRILSYGFNSPIGMHDPTAHAEIVVIRKAALACKNYRLPQCTLYVTIEPCIMCVGAIIQARIARVVFGAPEQRAGSLVSHPFNAGSDCYNHKFEFRGGVLKDAAGAMMKSFFKSKRNSVKSTE